MVSYHASEISTRRLFVFSLMISLFVHLVSVFLIKVKFIDVKYPGPQWLSVGIKDDLWFESGIELPSAAQVQDQQEMKALFQYQYNSEQLHLLSPQKPVMTDLQPEIDEIPFRMPQLRVMTEKINYSNNKIQNISNMILEDQVPSLDSSKNVISDRAKEGPVNPSQAIASPVLKIAQKVKEGKDRVLQSVMQWQQPVTIKNDSQSKDDGYILEGPVKDREIEFIKLPDCIAQPKSADEQNYQQSITWVRIEFWVRPGGNIGYSRVLQSSEDPFIDAHIVISLEAWKFKPLLKKDLQNDSQRGIITFKIQRARKRTDSE